MGFGWRTGKVMLMGLGCVSCVLCNPHGYFVSRWRRSTRRSRHGRARGFRDPLTAANWRDARAARWWQGILRVKMRRRLAREGAQTWQTLGGQTVKGEGRRTVGKPKDSGKKSEQSGGTAEGAGEQIPEKASRRRVP